MSPAHTPEASIGNNQSYLKTPALPQKLKAISSTKAKSGIHSCYYRKQSEFLYKSEVRNVHYITYCILNIY